MTGRIKSATDEAAELDVRGQHRTIVFADVEKAKVQIEFNRPAGTDDTESSAADGALEEN